jgi:hypothetical protein
MPKGVNLSPYVNYGLHYTVFMIKLLHGIMWNSSGTGLYPGKTKM